MTDSRDRTDRLRSAPADPQAKTRADPAAETRAHPPRGRDRTAAAGSELDDDSFLSPGGFLRGKLFDDLSDDLQITSPGAMLGPYRLIEKLGSGGMGEVWRAEQVEPVRRDIAVKLIKLGMDSADVLARFRAERQALARMSHSGIAKVYDAGTTEEGRPYFAMELVAGLPITDYCDQRRLAPRARLEIFVAVCEAVHHAHQKGIIHRDLKPSNILVAIEGDRPVPKIIDFGIAKAIGEPLEGGARTRIGQWMGTPQYMSPEQADQMSFDIDTRSDVYSLGAVLYLLLTGAHLHEGDELRDSGPEEMRRRIKEHEPQRPSQRLESSVDTASEIAERRGTEASSLVRTLRGDLDWIVMKAVEKERERRYQSAHELAQDVRRHLRDEPVLAGPPSTLYRLSKLVRRHRLAVATAAVIAIAILGGAALATLGLIRARQAEEQAVAEAERANTEAERANTEAARANTINRFLRGILGSARPEGGQGRDVTVLEALAAARSDLDRAFADDPQTDSDLRSVIGTTYHELGLHQPARELLTEALETRRELFGDVDGGVASTLNELARLEHTVGDLDRAEEHFREALEISRQLYGDESARTAATLNNLGMLHVHQGKLEEAESALVEALELKLALFGEVHSEVTPTLNNLGMLLDQRGEHERAQQYLERAVAANRELRGPEHGLVGINLNNLAGNLADQGLLERSEETYRQALAIKRKAMGEEHTSFGITLTHLGELLDRRGRHGEALPLHERALEIFRATLEPGHHRIAEARSRYGLCLTALGRRDEGEAEMRAGLASLVELVGEEDARTREARARLEGLAE